MANNIPTVTSREIASTNNTVNAFVGSKQRAWMTVASTGSPGNPISNGQTMLRKRTISGKPIDSTTRQSHPTTPNLPGPRSAQLTALPSTSRPAGKANPTQSNGIGAVQVLPSPAPSEGRPSPAATGVTAPETTVLEDSQQTLPSLPRENAPTAQENQFERPPSTVRSLESPLGQPDVETGIPASPQFMKPNARAVEDCTDRNSKRRKLEISAGVTAGTQTSTHPTPLTPVTSPGLMDRPVHHQNVNNGSSSAASPGVPAPASNLVRTSIPGPISIPIANSNYRQIRSPLSQVPNQLSPQQIPNQHQMQTQQSNLFLPSQVHQQVHPNSINTHQLAHRLSHHTVNLPPGSRRTSLVQNPNSPTTSHAGSNGPPTPIYKPQQAHNRISVADYLGSIGGNQALLPAERPRIEWLLHALTGQDWGFLTLHQLYCLSATNRGYLEYSKLVPPDAFPGFNFVGQILSDNRDVSPHFLDYFSRFPDVIQNQIGHPWYLTIIRDLVPFLRQGPHVYGEILQKCLHRRTSPTAEELVVSPFICSVVLQRLVWRRIRVHLDKGVETSSGAELEKQFIAQQFEVLKSRGLIPPPQTAQDHQWWLAQQQQAQIVANQQAIQNKFPELNRPLQTGFAYPAPQISPTFQQQAPFQQLRPGGHLPSAPMAIQDGSQQQTNQNVNGGNSLVTLQPGAQAGQHIPQLHQGQSNQVQLGASSTSQLCPLASTVATPRLPGNFYQTSVIRSPNAVAVATADSIDMRTVGSQLPTPPVQSPALGHRPSLAPRSNSVDHYIAVIGFAAQISLPGDLPCATLEFTVVPELANRLSVWEPHPGMPGRSKRTVQDRSLIYRLRCVQAVKEKGDINEESIWVLRETTWPTHMFVQLNHEPLLLRRKQIFTTDLFLDITNQIRVGVNFLKVAMLPEKPTPPKGSFLLRVEVLEARSYIALVNHVIPGQMIDKDTAKAAIMKRFKGSEDDDVVVVKLNELTLSIVCPFTMRLIKTPVRGKSCLHFECFDLDNYLISRPRKKPREPPNADSWKCPYCNGDARPTELVVDGFFQDMMTQLKGVNIDDNKEVIVKGDGSWELKKEEASKGKSPEKKQEELRKQVEVITIDDDDDD